MPWPARALGDLMLGAILAMVAFLERLQHRLGTDEARWWASNGRDLVNLFALVTLGLGLWAMGYSGPLSLAIAGSFVILLTAAQPTFHLYRHAAALTLLAALVLGAPLVLAPQSVATAYREAIGWLFP